MIFTRKVHGQSYLLLLTIFYIFFSVNINADTGEIITIDNLDDLATPQGYWATSGGESPYQSNSVYSLYDTFLWEADLPVAGEYIIEAYWTAWPNRSQQANYEITHANGSDDVSINQRTSGAEWVELGRYQFNAGRYGVTLSNNDPNNSTLSADAIRFVQVAKPNTSGTIEVDNLDSNVIREGFWATSAGLDPYEGNSEYSIGSTFSWLPMIMEAGRYQVQAYWTGYNNRSDEAQYTINHAEGASTATVDQKLDSNRWVSLGTYNFNSGDAIISLTNGNSPSTINADAIRLVPAPPIATSNSSYLDNSFNIIAEINSYFGIGYPATNFVDSNNFSTELWSYTDSIYCDYHCGQSEYYSPLLRVNSKGNIASTTHLKHVYSDNSFNQNERAINSYFRIDTYDNSELTPLYNEQLISLSTRQSVFLYGNGQSLLTDEQLDNFRLSQPILFQDVHIDDNGHIYVEYKRLARSGTLNPSTALTVDPNTLDGPYIQNYWLDDAGSVTKAQTIPVFNN